VFFGEKDPRYFQIAFLGSLLLYGIFRLDFSISLLTIVAVLMVSFAVQFAGIVFFHLPLSSFLSAAISGLSLLLLLRAQALSLMCLAAALSIASKFVFRFSGKHFFNPTNFGICVMLLISDRVWVSPGQWGEQSLLVFWILATGAAVVYSAKRYDISFAFLGAYFFLLLSRVLYLGQPLTVLFHQMQSGALLIFTFFMISDPRSTPNHWLGRLAFSIAVAVTAHYFRFSYFNPRAILWALFLLSPITIILDSLWKYRRYEWRERYDTPSYGPLVSFLFDKFRPRFLWLLRCES